MKQMVTREGASRRFVGLTPKITIDPRLEVLYENYPGDQAMTEVIVPQMEKFYLPSFMKAAFRIVELLLVDLVPAYEFVELIRVKYCFLISSESSGRHKTFAFVVEAILVNPNDGAKRTIQGIAPLEPNQDDFEGDAFSVIVLTARLRLLREFGEIAVEMGLGTSNQAKAINALATIGNLAETVFKDFRKVPE